MQVSEIAGELARQPKAGRLIIVVLSFLVVAVSCSPYNSPETARPADLPVNKSDEMRIINTGPVRYVALGDSTGAGVGAREGGYVARLFKRIKGTRGNSQLINLCISGATTQDVLARQVDAAVTANPTLVTIGIGINDIGHGLTPEQFRDNLDAILSRLRSGTTASIVISNIPDISTAPRIPPVIRPETQRLIALFNKQISELALRHQATVADIYKDTHQLLPAHPEYFSADGFHPSDEGYELWAERMWPTVAAAIGASDS